MGVSVVIFFANHYNELDHIAPVAYGWASEREVTTKVLLTGDSHLPTDYRRGILDELDGCSVHFVSDLVGIDGVSQTATPGTATASAAPKWRDTILEVVKSVGRRAPTRIPERIWGTVVTHPRAWLRDNADRIYEEVTEGADNAVIVFDWLNLKEYGSPQKQFGRRIVENARRDGFRTMAIPHGGTAFTSAISTEDIFETLLEEFDDPYKEIDNIGGLKRHWWNPEWIRPYDRYVVPNKYLADQKRHMLEEDALTVAGLPRFDPVWIERIDEDLPTYDPEMMTDGVNVVFLTQTSNGFFEMEEMVRAIRFLTSVPQVNLTVKLKTRPDSEFMSFVGPEAPISPSKDPNLSLAFRDDHTPSTFRWADAVVDMGTSATDGAVVRNIPVLVLDYVTKWEHVYPKYMPDTRMESPDQFYRAVQDLIDDENFHTYTPEEREQYIAEMIRPASPNQSALATYVELIDELFEEQGAKVSARAV